MKRLSQDKIYQGVIALLSAVALSLSVVMTVHSLSNVELLGCGAGSACDQTMNSPWSMLFGFFPVSGLAVCAYWAMLMCDLSLFLKMEAEVQAWAWRFLWMLAGTVVGSSLWFIFLQVYYLHTFCPYCMATHGTGLLLSVLILCAPRRFCKGILFKKRMLWCGAGLLLVLLLATLQWTTYPKNRYLKGQAEVALPQLDVQESPLIGSPTATYVLEWLYDYECTHCQRTHALLQAVVERTQGEVAFVACPIPLSPRCNPYIPAGVDRFEASCDLTRMALALWRCRHEAFYEFDNWLFEPTSSRKWKPRTVEEARDKACQLVDEAVLDAALQDPWIDDYLSVLYEIFGRTMRNGQGGIPRLVFGSQWVILDVEEVDGVCQILQTEFGIDCAEKQ